MPKAFLDFKFNQVQLAVISRFEESIENKNGGHVRISDRQNTLKYPGNPKKYGKGPVLNPEA